VDQIKHKYSLFFLKPIERDSTLVGWLEGCEKRGINPMALVLPVVKNPSSNVPGDGGGSGNYSAQSSEQTVYGDEGGGQYTGQSSQQNYSDGGDGDGYYTGQSTDAHSGGGSYELGHSSQAYDEYQMPWEDSDSDHSDGYLESQMEAEDSDGESGTGDDSDESGEEEEHEEQPNPAAWNHGFSSSMNVNDGHDSAWEYHQNNIAKGGIYADKIQLQDAIIAWSLTRKRELRTKASSGKYLTMVCTDHRCPARVHGYLPKNEIYWVVSDVVNHTCVLESVPQTHHNLSSTLIARFLYTEIVESKSMEVKAIMHKAKAKFDYNISYGKAWRAKQRALEDRFGSFFDAYDNVVRLVETLKMRNPGTYVEIKHLVIPEHPNVKVLQRLFFSFAICIEPFNYCRPVICVTLKECREGHSQSTSAHSLCSTHYGS
jgi:hypothetical protein